MSTRLTYIGTPRDVTREPPRANLTAEAAAGEPAGGLHGAGSPRETACSSDDLIELLFFAYRDFVGDPDRILAQYGFGRAHHRVLHFVNRLPGLTVAELLDVLKITKQSLARVLKQLIDTGHVAQVQGPRDRRQRELHPTPKGRALALALAKPQSKRIEAALGALNGSEREAVEHFLKNMVDASWRGRIDDLPEALRGPGRTTRSADGDG